MSILIKRFDPEDAFSDHEGTILASPVVPEGYPVPFRHQYGYLEPGKAMAGHSHPDPEIYLVFEGSGSVTVGSETSPVRAGDVIAIPVDTFHTMEAGPDAPLLWAALWWGKG